MQSISKMEGSDISYLDMIDTDQHLESPVKNFYEGQTIFITGATGFMGKILIEKLLRTCYGVKKLIIFARPKKGKDVAKRFEEQFSDPLYEKLRKERPNFMDKIWFVSGEVSELNLGISKENYDQICKEVSVIFHMAATVRFDEALSLAVKANVRGTREIVLLAKQSPNMKAFLYVSTAYANCVIKHIEEKFYDSPISAEKLIKLVETMDETTLQKITPTLLGDFPNTYAYTKVAAENVIRDMSKGLPVAVIRPSIIVGTYKNPIGGWIDNVYGPTGVVVAAAIGLLRTLHCDENEIADIIPVDFVINACLVITHEISKDHEASDKEKLICLTDDDEIELKIQEKREVPIYNYVSSNQNPLIWKDFLDTIYKYGLSTPSMLNIWVYTFRLNKHYLLHMLCVIFLQFIPAYIIDGISYCLGKKPKLVKAYQKINKFSNVISHFCTHNQRWYFKSDNIEKLATGMTAGDEALFDIDISHMPWDEYLFTYIRGIRVYLLKDPMETVEKARKRYRILEMCHMTLCIVLGFSLLRFLMFICKLMNLY